MPYYLGMSNSHTVTAKVDNETLAGLERVAAHCERDIEHVVTTAVLRFVNEELRHLPLDPDDPFANLPPYVDPDPLAQALSEAERKAIEAMHAYLKVGDDAADRGETYSQEEMEEWFVRRVADRARAAAAE